MSVPPYACNDIRFPIPPPKKTPNKIFFVFLFAAQDFLHECAPLSKTMLRALEIVWTCRSCSFILLLKMKSDPSALEMSTNVLG